MASVSEFWYLYNYQNVWIQMSINENDKNHEKRWDLCFKLSDKFVSLMFFKPVGILIYSLFRVKLTQWMHLWWSSP